MVFGDGIGKILVGSSVCYVRKIMNGTGFEGRLAIAIASAAFNNEIKIVNSVSFI